MALLGVKGLKESNLNIWSHRNKNSSGYAQYMQFAYLWQENIQSTF